MEEESIYRILDRFAAEEAEALRLAQPAATISKTHKIGLLKADATLPADRPVLLAEHDKLLSRENLVSSFSIPRRQHATFGLPDGQSKPTPLTRKLPVQVPGTTVPGPNGTSTFQPKPHLKPPVPARTEAPLQGLSSNADFIRKNQFWATSLKPPAAPEPMDYTKKVTYGKIPDYLDTIKMTIDKENAFLKELHERRTVKPEPVHELPAEEITELKDRLGQRHHELTQAYQRLTHVTKNNTIGFIRRKEGLEKALGDVERDLACLAKDKILIVK